MTEYISKIKFSRRRWLFGYMSTMVSRILYGVMEVANCSTFNLSQLTHLDTIVKSGWIESRADSYFN